MKDILGFFVEKSLTKTLEMKTSKRTPTAKGRRKVAGRPMDPYGNDIFDIIDYYYTYDRGRQETLEMVREYLGPELEKVIRVHEDTVQTLQQENVKKEKELAEKDTELVKAKESLEKKSAFNEKLLSMVHDRNWTLRDNTGNVVARAGTMERLAQVIYSVMKNGGPVAGIIFNTLKQAVDGVGPANPKKDSFAGTVWYSENSKELWEKWSSIPEGEFIKKFKNFTARPASKEFIRPPIK